MSYHRAWISKRQPMMILAKGFVSSLNLLVGVCTFQAAYVAPWQLSDIGWYTNDCDSSMFSGVSEFRSRVGFTMFTPLACFPLFCPSLSLILYWVFTGLDFLEMPPCSTCWASGWKGAVPTDKGKTQNHVQYWAGLKLHADFWVVQLPGVVALSPPWHTGSVCLMRLYNAGVIVNRMDYPSKGINLNELDLCLFNPDSPSDQPKLSRKWTDI